MILCTLDRVGRRYGWWFARGRVEAGALERFGGAPVVGRAGLHAAKDVIGALAHARSAPLCLVRLGGRVVDDADQLSATERAVVATFDVQSDLRPLVARWVERALASAHEEPELRDAETHRARAGDARARAIDADEIVRDAEWVIEEGRADAATMARAGGEHLGASQRWAEARAAAFAHEAAGCLAEEQVTSVGRAVERLVRAEALLAELSESDDAIARAREAIEDAFREALAVEPERSPQPPAPVVTPVDLAPAPAEDEAGEPARPVTLRDRPLGAGVRLTPASSPADGARARDLLHRLLATAHRGSSRASIWPVPLLQPARSDYAMHVFVRSSNRTRAREVVAALDRRAPGVAAHVSFHDDQGQERILASARAPEPDGIEALGTQLRAHARDQGELRNDGATRFRAEMAMAGARAAGWVGEGAAGAQRCMVVWADSAGGTDTAALLDAIARATNGHEHAVVLRGDPFESVSGDFLFTGQGRDVLAGLGPERDAEIATALLERPAFERASGFAAPRPEPGRRDDPPDELSGLDTVAAGTLLYEPRRAPWSWRRRSAGREVVERLLSIVQASRYHARIWPIPLPPDTNPALRLPFFVKARAEADAARIVEQIERSAARLPGVGAFVVWGDHAAEALSSRQFSATQLFEGMLAQPPLDVIGMLRSPCLSADRPTVLRAEMALAGVRAAGWEEAGELLLVWSSQGAASPDEVVARARDATEDQTPVVVIFGADPVESVWRHGNFRYTESARHMLNASRDVRRTVTNALFVEPIYRAGCGLTRPPAGAPPPRRLDGRVERAAPPARHASAWTSALATAVERSQLAAAVQLSPRMQETGAAVDAGCARCGARYLLPDGTPLGSTRCSGCGAMGLEGVTHGAIGETEPGRCPSCSAQLRAPAITAREHGPRYHVRCPACGQAVRPIPSAQPAPE